MGFPDGVGLRRGSAGLIGCAALACKGSHVALQRGSLPLQQRQRSVIRQRRGGLRQNVGAALGLLRRAGSTVPGVDALLPDLSLLLRRLMAQAVHPLGQGGHLLLGLTGLLLQGVQLLQGLVQLCDVPFQHRDLAGLVVLAAV